jgi:LemA protein
MFPTNIIAGLFGFKRRTLFEIPESERTNINVGNLFNS